MKIERTHIDTALRALSVCAADAELNVEEAQTAALREYYGRKRAEYETAYTHLHSLVEDNFFATLDMALTASGECLDCPDMACSVCADMRK